MLPTQVASGVGEGPRAAGALGMDQEAEANPSVRESDIPKRSPTLDVNLTVSLVRTRDRSCPSGLRRKGPNERSKSAMKSPETFWSLMSRSSSGASSILIGAAGIEWQRQVGGSPRVTDVSEASVCRSARRHFDEQESPAYSFFRLRVHSSRHIRSDRRSGSRMCTDGGVRCRWICVQVSITMS